jgi:putative membrane protein
VFPRISTEQMAASRQVLANRQRGDRMGRHTGIGLCLLTALVLLLLVFADAAVPTPLARSMAVHVALMSLVAPAVAAILVYRVRTEGTCSLIIAVSVQSAILYVWHSPIASEAAMRAWAGMAAMQVTLLLAAIWFWYAVFRNLALYRWRAVVALLITGKLFCLLGVLLVFAPRLLGHGADLADQQLAGLIMLAACPPTYIGSALIVCCRGIPGFSQEHTNPIRMQSS